MRIKVVNSKKGIFISQRKYVHDHLQKKEKLRCKPTSVPIEKNNKVSFEDESAKVDKGIRKVQLFGTHQGVFGICSERD